MKRVEQISIHLGVSVGIVGVATDDGTQCCGVNELVNKSVAVAYPYDVERDGCRHTKDESLLRDEDFFLHLFGCGAFAEYLYNSLVVDTVNGTYTTSTDYFASRDVNVAHNTFDVHYLCEARHFENMIDVGTGVDDAEVCVALSKTEHYSQSGT